MQGLNLRTRVRARSPAEPIARTRELEDGQRLSSSEEAPPPLLRGEFDVIQPAVRVDSSDRFTRSHAAPRIERGRWLFLLPGVYLVPFLLSSWGKNRP